MPTMPTTPTMPTMRVMRVMRVVRSQSARSQHFGRWRPLQAERCEVQLRVHRGRGGHRVEGAEQIVEEMWRSDLVGSHRAAGFGVGLRHDDAPTCIGQDVRGNQTVRSCADHDGIGVVLAWTSCVRWATHRSRSIPPPVRAVDLARHTHCGRRAALRARSGDGGRTGRSVPCGVLMRKSRRHTYRCARRMPAHDQVVPVSRADQPCSSAAEGWPVGAATDLLAFLSRCPIGVESVGLLPSSVCVTFVVGGRIVMTQVDRTVDLARDLDLAIERSRCALRVATARQRGCNGAP